MNLITLDEIHALGLPDRQDLVLVIDIETFYDPKNKISLRMMNYTEYGYHPETDILMVGLTVWGEQGRHYQWVHDEPGAPPLREWLLAFGYDNATVVCHNAFFDLFHLNAKLGIKPNVALCTQCMASYLFGTPDIMAMYRNRPGGSNSLDSLGQKFVPQIRKTKEVLADMAGKRAIHGTDHELAMRDYLHRDVLITYGLAAQWVNRVPKMQRQLIHWAISQLYDPVLELDSVVLLRILKEDHERLTSMMGALGITKTMLTSNPQFAKYLTDNFNVTVPTKISPTTGNKIFALAKNDVAYQEFKREHLAISTAPWEHGQTVRDIERSLNVLAALEAREFAKSSINRTRAQSYLDVAKHTGGKWPVHIMPAGAHTNRPTGGPGGGGNPLNLSKKSELRKAIRAPENHYLFKFDYTGIELRVARAIARDKDSLDKITNGVDLYCDTIGRLLDLPVDPEIGLNIHPYHVGNVTKQQRFIGKILELSSQYGVGAPRMYEALSTSGVLPQEDMPTIEECQEITRKFRKEIHPALPRAWRAFDEWIEATVRGGVTRGGVETERSKYLRTEVLDLPPEFSWVDGIMTWPSGRQMFYPHLHANHAPGRRGYAYKPRGNQGESKWLYGAMALENASQSLTAEVIDSAQLKLEAGMKREHMRVALQVYDELVLVVHNSIHVQELKPWVESIATAHPEWWPSCPELLIECSVGDNYGELTEI